MEKIFTVEAKNLEEARAIINKEIPNGSRLIAERIDSYGSNQSIQSKAETTETAFVYALAKLPDDVQVTERKILDTPFIKSITVDATDEDSATREIENQFGNSIRIKSLKITASGRKGFFGIGKVPNKYEIEIQQYATVEIIYKGRVKITVKIGDKEDVDTLIAINAEAIKTFLQRMPDASPGEIATILFAQELGSRSDLSEGSRGNITYSDEGRARLNSTFLYGDGKGGIIITKNEIKEPTQYCLFGGGHLGPWEYGQNLCVKFGLNSERFKLWAD